MKMIRNLVAVSVVTLLLAACASNNSYDRTPRENAARSAAVGAAVGAGIGAISSSKHRGRNALIGAGVGGTVGAVAGAQ